MSNQSFAIVTGPIRADARPVHIYNDGLAVFLYDEGHAAEIRGADPRILYYVDEEVFDDPSTKSLLAAGKMLVYGMHGDGGGDLEVIVGDPLDQEELATGRWYPTERGFLALASGKLNVHSYNTLPMGDNDEDPEDEGAIVDVPPGNYAVHLYRKDWEKMEEDDIANLDEADEAGIDVYEDGRVDDVIVLTPTDRVSAGEANVLFRSCID